MRVWLEWCTRRTQGFIAARVTGTWFAVGVTNRQERERIPSLWWKERMSAESSLAAQPCAHVMLLCPYHPLFIGHPAYPFIGEGKARVTEEEKERNEREEGLQDRRVLLLHAGPTGPIDVNRDSSISRSCPSLEPYAGVICWSWRSTLSW